MIFGGDDALLLLGEREFGPAENEIYILKIIVLCNMIKKKTIKLNKIRAIFEFSVMIKVKTRVRMYEKRVKNEGRQTFF